MVKHIILWKLKENLTEEEKQAVMAKAKTGLEGLVCIGVASVVIFQVIVNVGMCLFVMPVIGLTLPFISYGGSSLVMLFMSMGMVSGVQGRSKPDWLR